VVESSTTEKLLVAIALAAVIAVVTALAPGVLFRTYRNTTAAMEPTLPTGAHIVATRKRVPARKDIVIFRYPAKTERIFAKRVVALAGDKVEIRQKKLFINGNEVVEPYVVHEDPQIYPGSAFLPEPYRSRDNFGPVHVPPAHVFVMGDNRDRSFDSRYFGTIPQQNINGRVVLAFTWRRGLWRPVSSHV
jgi:signal peptidase I